MEMSGEVIMSSNMSVDQILSQMRNMRIDAQQRLTQPQPTSRPEEPFANLLTQELGKVNDLQQASGVLKNRLEVGDPNVDLTQVMLASQKASIAFTATLQVRNRLVQAYQDVMNMPL